jgi:hypothetical protein
MNNVHRERDIKVMRFQSHVGDPRVPVANKIKNEVISTNRRNLLKESD